MESKSPIARMMLSRKGLAALAATVVAIIMSGALMTSYFQGKLAPDAFFDHLEKLWGGVIALWGVAFVGWSMEDAAAKSSAPIAAGGDVLVAKVEETKPEKST